MWRLLPCRVKQELGQGTEHESRERRREFMMRDGVLYGTMFGAGLATALVAGSMLGELGVTPKPPESLPVHAAAMPLAAQPAAEIETAVSVAAARVDRPGDAAVGAPIPPVSNDRTEVSAALPAISANRLREAHAIVPLAPVAADQGAVLATPAGSFPPNRADQSAVASPTALAAVRYARADAPVAAQPDGAALPLPGDKATTVMPAESPRVRLAVVHAEDPAPAPRPPRLDRERRSAKPAPRPPRMASVDPVHAPEPAVRRTRALRSERNRMATRDLRDVREVREVRVRRGPDVAVHYGTNPGLAAGPLLIRIHPSRAGGRGGPVRTSRIPLY
jgi:hypothetical protein